MNTKTMILMGALSSSLLLSSACEPVLSGEKDNLALTYDKGPVSAAKGSSPIARGAKMTYSVTEKGENKRKLSIDSAQSSDEKVISVVSASGTMVLEAFEEGSASIDVDAKKSNTVLSDTFEVRSAEVDSLAIKGACASDGDPVHLVDSDIRMHYTMKSGSDIAVGYGYYPIEFEPQDGAVVGESTLNGLLPLRTGAAAGSVTINSTVSEDTFTLELVEPKDIDELKIYDTDFHVDGGVGLRLDDVTTFHIVPQAGDERPVCQSDVDLILEVATPDICELRYIEDADDDHPWHHFYEPNVLEIKGLDEGKCEFSVTMPAANDGAGVTLEHSLNVGSGEPEDQLDD